MTRKWHQRKWWQLIDGIGNGTHTQQMASELMFMPSKDGMKEYMNSNPKEEGFVVTEAAAPFCGMCKEFLIIFSLSPLQLDAKVEISKLDGRNQK
jgi:hypothetical protein